jgi:hypothetical protein
MVAPFLFHAVVCSGLIALPSWRTFVLKKPLATDTAKDVFNSVVNATNASLVFFYTYLVITLTQPFYCMGQQDGSWTMVNAPYMDCFSPNWWSNLPFVLFFFMLYVIIAPTVILVQLYKNRSETKSDEFRAKYGSLVSPYSDSHFYWEFVVIFKKILISITIRVLSIWASVGAQKFWFITLLFTSLVVDIFAMPYNSPFRNQCNLL